ncbi:MAG: tRNA (N(6)-L-threonylcarbamoyladenosine(37)-C(2))-methylthiotransferase [Candidatus Hodarchaeales archaeon]
MDPSKQKKKTVYLFNFGCSANQAIAEGIKGTLKNHAYELTESVEEAETVIINTCIVKQNTEHRMKSLIQKIAKDKEVIVTGCLPVVMKDWLVRKAPNAKILFPEVAGEIVPLLEGYPIQEVKTVSADIWSHLYKGDRVRNNPIISIIEISRGCLGNCAYCIVKKAKGSLRSRNPQDIIQEIKNAILKGSKEIWLTSQDTGSYGYDLSPRVYLPSLLKSIVEIPGNFFLRIGMMTPNTVQSFKKELIFGLNLDKVFSFLHLPIQSGSNLILRAMRRKEDKEYFIQLVKELREEVPELILATDIIVGFPGETENDFEETKRLIKELKFEIVNISKYTDRPGTDAARMPNKVPTKIKSERSRELSKITRSITKNKLRKWIDWEGSVIIDEYGKRQGQLLGRNSSYLPILFEEGNYSLGEFVRAKIIDSRDIYLIAEHIS